jgi:hypothetical protein
MPEIRRAGSVGVKADIDIESSQFRAASGVVGQIDEGIKSYKANRQQLRDDAANADYISNNINFTKAIKSKFKNEHDADERRKILEEELSNRNEYIDGLAAKMSKKEAAVLKNNSKIDNAKMRAIFEGQIETDEIGQDNASIISAANNLMNAGQRDEALAQIDKVNNFDSVKQDLRDQLIRQDQVNTIERIETAAQLAESTEDVDAAIAALEQSDLTVVQKERTKQKLDKRRDSLFAANERFIMEEVELQSLDSNRISDVKALGEQVKKNDDLGKKAKAQLQQTLSRREHSIQNTDISSMSASLKVAQKEFDLVLDGGIISELQLSDSYDPVTKEAVANALEAKGGPRGTNSNEYLELLEEISDFDGTGAFQDDLTREHKKKVVDFLNDPENSTEAKLNIASESLAALSIDVSDLEVDTFLGVKNQDGKQVLEWRDETIELDESQALAVRKFGFVLDNLVLGANQKGDFKDSVVSANDTLDLFMFIHQRDVIDSFAKIEDPEGAGRAEFDEKFDAVFSQRLNAAIENEAKRKFRERISRINLSLRELR